MASNVFGTPVTNATLAAMPDYCEQDTYTRVDRARAALLLKNDQAKDVDARKFVEDLREKHRDDGTQCLIYNATGDAVTLAAVHDWSGKVAKSPYPIIIQNGQWGAFLHAHFGKAACLGAVIYAGKNANDADCHWVFSWKQTNGQENACYIEVRGDNYYSKNNQKEAGDHIVPIIQRGPIHSELENNGCKIFASIGNTHSPLFEGIMTLKEAI